MKTPLIILIVAFFFSSCDREVDCGTSVASPSLCRKFDSYVNTYEHLLDSTYVEKDYNINRIATKKIYIECIDSFEVILPEELLQDENVINLLIQLVIPIPNKEIGDYWSRKFLYPENEGFEHGFANIRYRETVNITESFLMLKQKTGYLDEYETSDKVYKDVFIIKQKRYYDKYHVRYYLYVNTEKK